MNDTLATARTAARCAAPWLVALLAPIALAAPPETLRYELAPDFDAGVLRVAIEWHTGRRTQSALRVSERVGRVRDIPGLLHNVRIDGGRVRHKGAVWIIKHRPGATIRCNYTVDPQRRRFASLDEIHYPITTRGFFHGLGNAFLLAPAPMGATPDAFEVVLRWKLPAGCKAACSWGVGRHVGARLRAADLSHSVYLAGRLRTARRERAGRVVSVALVPQFAFSADDFAAMAARIIAAECGFMHETDFPEFVVTAIPVGDPLGPGEARLAGSGLYHSFAMFVAPEARIDDAVEHLFAHELFHYWNGRTLRAARPERLVYWFVEGFTDYYALRILYESGYWQPATYLKWINKHIRGYYRNPALHATNADIQRDYWNRRQTVGEMAYQRGLMLGLRWHARARRAGVASGLDRLMITLVDRGRKGEELSNALVRQAGICALGSWFGDEFDRYVVRAETIDLPADALGPEFVGRPTALYSYELGFDKQRSQADRRVRGLVPGSAAQRAGLRSGDRIVAWNLYADPDQRCKVKIRRDGQTRVITFLPRGRKERLMQFHLQTAPRARP